MPSDDALTAIDLIGQLLETTPIGPSPKMTTADEQCAPDMDVTESRHRNDDNDDSHVIQVKYPELLEQYRGGSRILIWGGGRAKDYVHGHTHITSSKRESLTAEVHGPLKGPGSFQGL